MLQHDPHITYPFREIVALHVNVRYAPAALLSLRPFATAVTPASHSHPAHFKPFNLGSRPAATAIALVPIVTHRALLLRRAHVVS